MDEPSEFARDVSAHRKITTQRLARLLVQAGFEEDTGAVEYIVYAYHHTLFGRWFSQMTYMFAGASTAVDKDALLFVMVDVWHYFPHASLGDRCPAEIVDSGETLGRWKTKPTKRASR